MIEASAVNQTSTTTGYQQKARRFKSFKLKYCQPKTPKKNNSEILWYHDLSGNKFNYNAKIANKLGLWAAIILETIRYWCSYNAHKKQSRDAYSFYKTGEEFAKQLGLSKATYWKIIAILKKEGLIETLKDENHYGKINIYILTPKYFDLAGLSTITKLEKAILFPKKEGGSLNQKNNPNLSETREEKIDQKFHNFMGDFADNLCLTVRQPLSTENRDFSQIDAGYSISSMVHNIQIYKIHPPTPYQISFSKTEFGDGLEESVFDETDNLKTRSVEDQENVKIRPARKRKPNERKKPLKGSRKVKSPARIEAIEKFEALHGFPSSLCREKHEEFYNVYPKKVDKEASYRAFVKVLFLLEISFSDLMKKVAVFKNSEDVQKRMGIEGGRYIKHPANWLWNKSWADIALPENLYRQRDVEKTTVQSFVDAQNAEIQPFLTHLCDLIGETAFLGWFTSLAYTLSGQELVMECQNRFREEHIRLKFGQCMEIALKKASLQNVVISFSITDPSTASSSQEDIGGIEKRR
jgi:DNA-binding MarR family transcriptional regulator